MINLKYIFKQHIRQKKKKNKDNKINWWELCLIGIGSIIGAGFFLGSEIIMRLSGTGSFLVFIVAGSTAYLVFTALAEMSICNPQEGSFRSYAYNAYGYRLAFLSGWNYWIAGILIMSSSVIALSVFTQYWFQSVPIWLFSIVYAGLSFAVVLLGVDNFAKTESVFAVLKISVLIIFILFGLLISFHFIELAELPRLKNIHWLSQGLGGFWHGLIYGMLPFCGIGAIGILASDLDKPRDILKSGRIIIFSLMVLYTLPLFFLLNFIPIESIKKNQSPFLTLLLQYNFPWIDSIFNLILILATFSTLVGTIYCITKLMHCMSVDGYAPKKFIKTNSKNIPTNALYLSTIGLIFAIVFSYMLPETIFEHLIGSASIMLVSNWGIILLSQRKIRSRDTSGITLDYKMPFFPFLNTVGMILVLFSLLGTVFFKGLRLSFFLTVVVMILLYLTASKIVKK